MLPQWSLMPAQHCSMMPMQMQGNMTQQNSATHLVAMALQQNVLAMLQNIDAGIELAVSAANVNTANCIGCDIER